MNSDSSMSDWSYLSSQVSPLSPQGIAVPQTPTHLKPPSETLNSTTTILDEEKEAASSLHVIFPYLQRLDSSNEEGDTRPLRAPSCNTRDDPASPPTFGNSLSVQGTATSVECVSNVAISILNQSDNNNIDCVRSERIVVNPSFVNSNNNNSSNNINISNNNASNASHSSRLNKFVLDSKSQNGSKSNSSASTSGCLSPPAVSNSSAPSFPSEPTILADKYVILGPVDASTSHALRLHNHQPLHVKAVTARTAREVCAQQALLDDGSGVRAPLEAVIPACGRRAWLVFPPHFGDLHSYVRLRRRLREAEAQRLFRNVAETVEKCHAAGLVLRDLKLRKFVFTDSNRQNVVLESVEDSVVAGESDLLHDKHGCPAYVAPEILSAAAYSGRHADMWGLGVILYTMLVGRYPFHNADTCTLFAKIRSGKFFIPEWVSSRARHLILSLLRRQPQRRLSARQVLLHPWLNRAPRDHVGKDPQDHIVPSMAGPIHAPSVGKSRPS